MTRRPSFVLAAVGGLILAVAVVLIGLVLLRPSSSASIGDGLTVACEGIGSDAACAEWAASILATGPGIRTFDPDDLARLRLTRPFLLPGDCEVEYYISRTLDEPVARETTPCPSA